MSAYTYFVGIDVSKQKLDIAFGGKDKVFEHEQIDNTQKGISSYFRALSKRENLEQDKVLVCIENTGRYMNLVLRYLSLKGYAVWVENAVSIKRSLGLQRGKNDKVDACRIAEYAVRFEDKARLYVPDSPTMKKLKLLASARKQLVNTRTRLKTELQEASKTEEKTLYTLKKKLFSKTLKALETDIKAIEEEMDSVFEDDEALKGMFTILCSVPGIGKVTAIALILVTQGFTKFDSAKKLACYCGVVPFEHRSGTSIRGKTRVSHFANKNIKSLLSMCSRSAIRTKTEFKTYYERKVGQGKQKMAVLNAIQNKLIHRAFALVRENRKYQKNYQHLLA